MSVKSIGATCADFDGEAMSREPRGNRVPIMMSDAEMTAVDDWRFAKRVATRSDAIRRLAQIGLTLDARHDALLDKIDQINATIEALQKQQDEILASDMPADAKLEAAFRAVYDRWGHTVRLVGAVSIDIGGVLAQAADWSGSETLDEAARQATRSGALFDKARAAVNAELFRHLAEEIDKAPEMAKAKAAHPGTDSGKKLAAADFANSEDRGKPRPARKARK
jgi:hypothetical protein